MGRFADSQTEIYINGRKRNMNILVSACLLGVECRYDGRGVLVSQAEELLSRHHLIPVCPEIMAVWPPPGHLRNGWGRSHYKGWRGCHGSV